MDIGITRIIELFILPPGGLIVILIMLIIWVKDIRSLKRLLVLFIIIFYGLSIPVTSHFLFSKLESKSVLTPNDFNQKADAIVVLAGGMHGYKKERGGPDLSGFSLQRIRYAAWLHKQTNLPIVVTGGLKEKGVTEAELMRQVLQQEYHITAPIYIEKASRNTEENARLSQEILAQQQIEKFYLVTNAFHMPRSLLVFKRYYSNIIPAPMGFYFDKITYVPSDFLPQSKSFRLNYIALHEILGQLWYRILFQFI